MRIDAESGAGYDPPALASIPDPRTLYTYDLDRKLDFVTRPDGKTVDLAYEAGTGSLDTVTIAEGVYDHGYHATTDPVTGEAAGQINGDCADQDDDHQPQPPAR